MTNDPNNASLLDMVKALLFVICAVIFVLVAVSFSGPIVAGILIIILANPLLAIIALCVFGIFAHITEDKK